MTALADGEALTESPPLLRPRHGPELIIFTGVVPFSIRLQSDAISSVRSFRLNSREFESS